MEPTSREIESNADIYVPNGPADTELEWFFTISEGDIRGPSAFVSEMTRVLDDPSSTTMEDRAEAAHAHRKMMKWFVEIGDHDAGVLKVAYMARPWPLQLREELGRLTGVVVRMAAAEVGLPDDDRALDALEQRTALRLDVALASGERIVDKRLRAASPVLRKAFVAYVRERGGATRPVLPGIS
jgi:hypothetical protein